MMREEEQTAQEKQIAREERVAQEEQVTQEECITQEEQVTQEERGAQEKQAEQEQGEKYIKGGYVPSFITGEIERKKLHYETDDRRLTVAVPYFTPPQLEQLVQQLQLQREHYLYTLTVDQIVERIAAAIEQLLDRQYLLRQQAEQLLPIITGYAPETIRLALTSQLKTFRKPQLLRFLQEDFTNYTMLDDYRPSPKGGFSKAYGPNLAAHIWAGNVPGLPLWSLISTMLVKSASVGKLPSAEPLFAGLFVQTLATIDQQLADCLAIVWWQGGDASREDKLFRQAELVLAYGGNDSLAALRSRVPITTRFVAFGHKISFALVGHEALNADKAWRIAHAAALDIVRFDQQGCYSPQLLVVEEGGSISPRQFADYLAHELSALAYRYPRRKLSLEEQTRLAQMRQKYELVSIQRNESKSSQSSDESEQQLVVIGGSDQSWTVVFEQNGRFAPGPLDRFVRVLSVSQLEEMVAQLAPYREFLQTAGLAAEPSRLFSLAERLGHAGVTRISAIGSMTEPEAGWHHDGRFNLADLVRIVDIELGAEQMAEQYATYRD